MKHLSAWICAMMVVTFCQLKAEEPEALRKQRDQLTERGMWREGLDFYRDKLLPLEGGNTGEDLENAVDALTRLAAWKEFDSLVESSLALHGENAAHLMSAASAYLAAPHFGEIVAGEFQRKQNGQVYRGRVTADGEPQPTTGQAVATDYRDRVRALQLIQKAVGKAKTDRERIQVWQKMAKILQQTESWKWQTLTPLDLLPEWGEPGPDGGTEGAPWKDNRPVLFQIPSAWETAADDGQRWRFALAEQVRLAKLAGDANVEAATLLERAVFSSSQFGTETLASFDLWGQQGADDVKGILAMDTLAEDECLAKTSDGVRRFKLTADQHFIALYQLVLNHQTYGGAAGDALVEVFLNRRQFVRAREILQQTIAKHGVGDENFRKRKLEQITGNWGRFGLVDTVATGTKPVLPLVFRNAKAIKLSASRIDMDAVIRDTQTYLKSNPSKFDWERVTPSNIASRLITGRADKYIGKAVAQWEVKLVPKDAHRDTQQDIIVPLEKAGAWWISGEIAGGNSFRTLVWIVDSVIVHNDVGGKKQWWLADAASGAPVADADFEFFGYRQIYDNQKNLGGNDVEIRTQTVTAKSDEEGKTMMKPGMLDENFQWLAIARKPDRVLAFYGFQPSYIATPQLQNAERSIAYGISDRPLYKPGDTAYLKFYFRNVGYSQPNDSRWANKVGTVTLTNGRGEQALKIEKLKTDSLGAVECKVTIPLDAVLGQWNATCTLDLEFAGSVSLQVEEYRKPEYEVKVEAPTDPVKLGDTFTATIKATYFHGSPVRNANVEITVKRGSMSERWFPAGRWDWLYGRGGWWNSEESLWHPTWSRWGCRPPNPPWWQGGRWTPDELVMKRNVAIGEDGTARIEVDTASAAAIHGDMEARYTIEAKVVDASRREERGSGAVIAARKPFEVIVWMDRGYTRAGEPVDATVSAATLAGKPVVGAKGTLKIYQITAGAEGRVEEKEVQSFLVMTDALGEIHQKFAAPATGQYRLAASLSLREDNSVEGAVMLNVHGPGRTEPKEWRFGPLELIADKATYAPGETLKLRVNSDRENANVWLFLHVAGSAGREARRIQLDGKSLEVEVPLDLRDMPNMFIEGISVHGAKVHTAVRQVLLPPVSKMIEVTLEPAKSRVKPRESSLFKVTLRDAEGKPVTGIAVLAVYDKSLEAITGGSNIGPIHEKFWTWKNHYFPNRNKHSIPSAEGNLMKAKALPMEMLGQFGAIEDSFGGGSGGPIVGGGRRDSEDSSAPAASAPMRMTGMALEEKTNAVAEPAPQAAANSILVRKDFADLLKWSGAIQTNAEGQAEVPLEYPDNLTTWKARVWVLTEGSRVGEGSTEIITSKELLVRLQAPRFLVERDEAVLSAVIQNDYDLPKTVKVSLELMGSELEALAGGPKTLEIAAKSEARVDWRVKALREGEAKFRMRAETEGDGDAVERTLPIKVHGMLRQDAWSRTAGPEQSVAKISLEVPAERRPDQSILSVNFSPTIAGAVVDAIPYLADFPYGCTEQTLNRFVPTVIAQKMLRELKINLGEVKAKRNSLNPQQLGESADQVKKWRSWQKNPVFDPAEVEKMAAVGVKKLSAMQNSDGGWGWFSGYGESSYPHTTAVVMHGLLIAKENGASVQAEMLKRGINWLANYERRQTAALQYDVECDKLEKQGKKVKDEQRERKSQVDAQDAFVRRVLGEAKRDSEPMLAFLYRDRIELPVYAMCLLGLEHHRKADNVRRDEVMRVISQFLKRDEENQTTYLELRNNGYWWNWYGSDVEAHAWYLKLLAAVKPNDADTRGLVKYLVNNRKHASYWESTRDTAFAIEAIADYLKASGEIAPEMDVEVLLDGKSLHKILINRENLFTFDGSLVVSGQDLTTGKHEIELRKSGKGSLYANAYLEVFNLEDKLRAAGLEVKVTRHLSKLIALEKVNEVPNAAGVVVKQQVERFRREPLVDGAKLASGDQLEVELVLESKNDYEYLIFSDAKAAGLEALEALSGYVGGGSGFSAYMQPRDQSVDFFIRALPRGTHTLRYQLRAETPGIYKALPATAEAMYAPELRANSEDIKLEITD